MIFTSTCISPELMITTKIENTMNFIWKFITLFTGFINQIMIKAEFGFGFICFGRYMEIDSDCNNVRSLILIILYSFNISLVFKLFIVVTKN